MRLNCTITTVVEIDMRLVMEDAVLTSMKSTWRRVSGAEMYTKTAIVEINMALVMKVAVSVSMKSSWRRDHWDELYMSDVSQNRHGTGYEGICVDNVFQTNMAEGLKTTLFELDMAVVMKVVVLNA